MSKTTHFAPADRRAIVLAGVPADHSYSFSVQAYRRVQKDVAPSGVILSATALTNLYKPTLVPAFQGDITGTIQGRPSIDVVVNLEAIASDSVLSTTEKPALILTFNQLSIEASTLIAKANAAGNLTDEVADAQTAVSALTAYLTSLTPPWNDTAVHTPIVPATFQAAWAAAYAAIANLSAAISGNATPLITITPSRTAFTYKNGVLTPPVQTATLNATAVNVSGTIIWSTAPNIKSGTGPTFTLTPAEMGAAQSVVVAATVGDVSASITITKLADNLATNGGDPNAPLGPNGTVADILATIQEAHDDAAAATAAAAQARQDVADANADIDAANALIASTQADLATEIDRAKSDTASIRTVQSQLQTDVSGNSSLISTEQTNRANADSALADRASSLETVVNDGVNGNLALRSTINSEVSARTTADLSISARTDTLESIAGNYAINKNSQFAKYTNATGLPDFWNDEGTGAANATRVAGRIAQYGCQLAGPAGSSSYIKSILTVAGLVSTGQWVVLEFDIKLNSGTLEGAGCLLGVFVTPSGSYYPTFPFSTTPDATDQMPGAGVVGQTYSYRMLYQIPYANASRLILFPAAHHPSLGSIADANSITFYRAAVRYATSAEIAAKRADSNASAALANITTEETARTTADTALAQRATTLEASVNSGPNALGTLRSAITDEATVRANTDSSLASRVSTLESSTPADSSTLTSRIATEETTRANADTALANRTTTLESTVNDSSKGNTALKSQISTEETTRSTADQALATRATNLESTVNDATKGNLALQARIATEETTRANATSAIAARTTSLEARSGIDGSSITNNPTFSNWATDGTPPDGWSWWDASAGITRANGINGKPYAAQFTPTAFQNAGIYQYINAAFGAFVIEFTGRATDWQGAGVLVQFIDDGGTVIEDIALDATTLADTSGYANGDGGGGVYTRSWSMYYKTGINGNIRRIILYAMANWGGFGTRHAKTITFDRVSVRPATAAEIAAQRADTNATQALARITTEETARTNADSTLASRTTSLESYTGTLNSRVTTNEGAITSLNNKASAYWQVTAVAGNNRAQLTVHADANGGGGVDIVGDVTFAGTLNVGPDSGQRTKITNSGVFIYDSNNVLRVRLGQW